MLTGKRFRLERETLSVESTDGKHTAVTIPTGAIIEVLSGRKNREGLVRISWNGRTLQMFAVDVDARGIEIEDHRLSV
jgi:hypothetical protein